MGHENDGIDDDNDEIEKHLIEKITHAIDDHQGDNQQNLLTKYFASFEAEFRELITTLTPKTNPSVADDWLSLRRENLYSLNNLFTEWQITKNQSSFSPKEIYNSRENMIKNSLKKMKKELHGEETSSRGDHGRSYYHQEPNHPIFPRNKKEVYRWSSRHGPRKVHGFEHKIMAMERDLVMRNIDAAFKVFGVVGVAGIGKTTLCQAIFGRKLVTEYFSPRLWVCLSKQPSGIQDYRKDIVVRILKCLGVEDEVINDAGKDDAHELRRLILLLRLQLTGKRYLIVLDDAWNDDKFFMDLAQKDELEENWGEELACGLPKNGAVISSSRSDALLKKMFGKDVNLQYLKPHSKEIIDEIFKDTVIGYDEDEREFPQHLIDLKKEILEKCDGIPLAAKLLAKIAREQLPVKPKPAPPPPAASGVQEIRRSPAALRFKDGGGVRDDDHKGGFRP